MALDFPSSPTNGQVYGNFIWSSAKGAWQAKPITGKVTTSATAPSAPSNGDEWFNTNDGNIYVYYTDVDGSQWVQVKSDATLSSTLGNRVEALEAKPSGLVPVAPTSISVSSGSGSVSPIGVATFTGAASLSLNGVFTGEYANYRFLLNASSTSTTTDLALRFRTAGVDNTATAHQYAKSSMLNTSWGADYQSGTTFINFGRSAGTGGLSSNMDIFSPQLPQYTKILGEYVQGSATWFGSCWGNNQSTNQFDGITIYPLSANMTGTFQVFGYND